MNKTLRFFSLFASCLAFGIVANAQRQIPLTVTFTSPTQGQQVPFEENYYCIFNIHNGSATEALTGADTLIIAFTGEPDFQYSDEIMLVLAPAIAPGGNAVIPIFLNPNNNTTGATINKEYCVSVFGFGNFYATGAWMNASPDPFEEACVNFSLLSGQATVSIDEVDASTFNVYPNPANDQINIDFANISAEASIVVHNSMGQRVYAVAGNSFRSIGAINSSNWSNGIYLVTITQDGLSHTQRVTVQH